MPPATERVSDSAAAAPRSPKERMELALQSVRAALSELRPYTLPEHVIRPRWSPDGRMAFGEHADRVTKRYGVTFFDDASNSRFIDDSDPPSEPYSIKLPSGNEYVRRTTVIVSDLRWRHDSVGPIYGLSRSVVTIDAMTGTATEHRVGIEGPTVPRRLITSPDGRIAAGVVWPEEDRHDEALMRLHYGPHWDLQRSREFGDDDRLRKLASEARAAGKHLARPEDVISVPVHVRLIDLESGSVRDVSIYNGILMDLKGLSFSFCGRWLAVLLDPQLFGAPLPPGVSDDNAELILVDVKKGAVAHRRAGVEAAYSTAERLAWRQEASEVAVMTTTGTRCLRVDDSGRLSDFGGYSNYQHRFAWVPGHRVLLAIAEQNTTPFLRHFVESFTKMGNIDEDYRTWAMLIDPESGRTLTIPELVEDYPRGTYTDYLALPQVNRLIDMWNP